MFFIIIIIIFLLSWDKQQERRKKILLKWMGKNWKKGECGFGEGQDGEIVIRRYVGLNNSWTKHQMASLAQDCLLHAGKGRTK